MTRIYSFRFKRILGVFLALIMFISILTVPANAAPNKSNMPGKWSYRYVGSGSKRVKKKYSYEYSDGTTPERITRIGEKVYLFGSDGILSMSTESNRMIRFRGKIYLIGSDGVAKSGWRVYKNKLYYFSKKTFAALTNRKFGGILLGTDGTAKNTLNANLKKECIKILGSITKSSDSKATKLAKAYNYMASRKNFSYALKYPDLTSKSWGKTHAYNMLTTHSGNCYSFACAFAALAQEIGYESYVVPGRIHGNRDRSPDGYTRHCVAMVGGLYYDPELRWASGSGVFAASYCPVSFVQGHFRFKSFEGNILTNHKKASVEKNKVVLKDGYYQYYDSKGNSVYGTYYVKGKLFKFKKNEGMSVSDYNKLQSYTKEGTAFSDLKKYIGEPSESSSATSCYIVGATDYIHKYKHIIVYTVKEPYGIEKLVSISSK